MRSQSVCVAFRFADRSRPLRLLSLLLWASWGGPARQLPPSIMQGRRAGQSYRSRGTLQALGLLLCIFNCVASKFQSKPVSHLGSSSGRCGTNEGQIVKHSSRPQEKGWNVIYRSLLVRRVPAFPEQPRQSSAKQVSGGPRSTHLPDASDQVWVDATGTLKGPSNSK